MRESMRRHHRQHSQQSTLPSTPMHMIVVLSLLLLASHGHAFSIAPWHRTSSTSSTTQLCMAKKRKAKQALKTEIVSPANKFATPESSTPLKKKKKKKKKNEQVVMTDDEEDPLNESSSELERQRRLERKDELEKEFATRPEVSTLIYDDTAQADRIVQGKNVLDVVTRQAVQLSSSPELCLAQMFPGVPPNVAKKYRVDYASPTLIDDIIQGYTAAAMVMLPDGSRDIPPHPSVSTHAIDFVLANRDIVSGRVPLTKLLGRAHMRALSLQDKPHARRTDQVWKNYLTVENHIAAPFRQMILDAENRVGPNFGNLDVPGYCTGLHLYERCAVYVAFKGMVEHWKKKVVDANTIENTEVTTENWVTLLNTGDPRRFLPDSPVYYTLNDCTRIYDMAAKMCQAFCETPELFDDLPVELRFLQAADTIKGGTALRKYVAEEFCPKEQVSASGLREGLRRLQAQVETLQIDPYGELHAALDDIVVALSVGTEDDLGRDPYFEYASDFRPDSPGFFQTYTFNHDPLSHVRFLDSEYDGAGPDENLLDMRDIMNIGAGTDVADLFKSDNNGSNMWEDMLSEMGIDTQNNSDGEEEDLRSPEDDFSVLPKEEVPSDTPAVYKVPKERAIGRPHDLGWLKLLDDDPIDETMKFGKVPPGKIIADP